MLFLAWTILSSKLFAQAPQHIQIWNEVFTEASVDRHSGDEFGFSVSVGSTYAAVGAPSHDFSYGATVQSNSSSADYREDAGAVYLYEKFGTFYRNEVKLTAPDRQAFDLFGYSVSVFGSMCAVGAPGEDHDATGTSNSTNAQANYVNNAGAVYLFSLTGTTWNLTAKITAPARDASDQFGSKVVLHGSRLVVSSPLEDHDASEQNGLTNAGSVYVYSLVNGSWVLEQKLVPNDRAVGDEFGSSVDFDGTCLIVGARFADILTAQNQGAAYTFIQNSNWIQQSKILSSDGAANDLFGSSVAVYGTKIAAGSPGNLGRGAVYAYSSANNTWGGEQKLVSSDIQAQDQFGESISLYGDTLVVASPGEDHDGSGTSSSTTGQGFLSNAGAAYIFFRLSSGGWSQSQKMNRSNRVAQANFSFAVDVFQDDLFVGAPYQEISGIPCGSASFFGKDVYVWIGSTSADPGNSLNWKEGAVPPMDHDLLFTKGSYDPIFTSAIYANRITVLPNVELKITAPNVIRADGSISNDGVIFLLGANTGTYSSLLFKGAYMGAGTVVKEQFLSAGWHQVASPMQNAWAITVGGNSSSLVPYSAATGNYGGQGSSLTEVGRGFFAQVSAGSPYGGSAFMSSASMFSVQGVPRTQATFSLGYANNNVPVNFSHTSKVIDGWNLLGNPFSCPIDFRLLTRSDVDPYFSIWDPSLNGGLGGHKFFSYVGGSLSYVIPPMQGFWVRAWSASSTISPIQMSQVGTISSLPKLLKKEDLRLKFVNLNDTTFTDQIWISEVIGASADTFNLHVDVPKQFAPNGAVNAFIVSSNKAISAKAVEFDRDTMKFMLSLIRPNGNWVVEPSGSRFDEFTWTLFGESTKVSISLTPDERNAIQTPDTTFTLFGVRKSLSVSDKPIVKSWVTLNQGRAEVRWNRDEPMQVTWFNAVGQMLETKVCERLHVSKILEPGFYLIQLVGERTGIRESHRVIVP